MSNKPRVLVTGASGFIGSHIVRELLERGYPVRATVRDASNKTKTRVLKDLPGADERLEIASADVLQPGSFDEHLNGCTWVCHAAAAVKLAAKNPQKDIVDPAVNGTAYLLDSVRKNGKVERLNLISSVAAILGTGPERGYVYSEADWNTDATLSENPYGLAKRESEKLVHELAKENGAPIVSVINPVVVLGPLLSRLHVSTSTQIARDLYTNAFKGCPGLGFAIVDVRDVADATVAALEQSKTGRYILHSDSAFLKDMATIIKDKYPEAKTSLRRVPNFVMYVMAMFDSRLTYAFLRRNLDNAPLFDNTKLQRELGIKPRSLETALVACVDSMRQLRVLKP